MVVENLSASRNLNRNCSDISTQNDLQLPVMPVVPDIDVFIRQAGDFLAANPSTTLSITYSNHHKRAASGKVSKPSAASNVVSVKLFEPSTGSCIKFRTYKSKELSKLLNFIGPNGVNIVSTNSQAVGLASIMTNTKSTPTSHIEAPSSVDGAAATPPNTTATSSVPQPTSKKSKKKGKKKN